MNLIEQDLQHIWHPCSQMKDFQQLPLLEVVSAQGSYLELADGQQLIDACGSWWCKSLGHNHPEIKQALFEQAEKFEHSIFANTTNETIVKLSTHLSQLTNTLNKVSYASEGSSAVEMALKMSLHANQLKGFVHKNKFMALKNGYHGETCLALAVSDLGLYRDTYQAILPDVNYIPDIPYVSNIQDPLWHDCSGYWPAIETFLNKHHHQLSAIILEPILQGAAGMQVYSQDFLRRLRQWTKQHQVHLIADEIMTGFGRTGLPLACQHADIEPDFLCLAKGLSAGWLPISVMLTSDSIYDLFYDDYKTGKAFLHSHTFSGNALAASCALKTMEIMSRGDIYQQVREQESYIQSLMQEIADDSGMLTNVRGIGSVVAADLKVEPTQRAGFEVLKESIKQGALLRPLGNTIYWFLPLNAGRKVYQQLQAITSQSIAQALKNIIK